MEKILKHLDFVIQQTNAIADSYDKKKLDDITMFCMCMLDRMNFASESIKILLERFHEKPQVDYGCGIIVRSLLLDYLIVLNAFEVYGKNVENHEVLQKELSKFCLMMLCDSVRHTLDYFKSLDGIITEEQ